MLHIYISVYLIHTWNWAAAVLWEGTVAADSSVRTNRSPMLVSCYKYINLGGLRLSGEFHESDKSYVTDHLLFFSFFFFVIVVTFGK